MGPLDATSPDVGLNARGDAAAVWVRGSGRARQIVASYKPLGGAEPAGGISRRGRPSIDPKVAVGPDGRVVVTWRQVARSRVVRVGGEAPRPGGPRRPGARAAAGRRALGPVVTLSSPRQKVGRVFLGVDGRGLAVAAWHWGTGTRPGDPGYVGQVQYSEPRPRRGVDLAGARLDGGGLRPGAPPARGRRVGRARGRLVAVRPGRRPVGGRGGRARAGRGLRRGGPPADHRGKRGSRPTWRWAPTAVPWRWPASTGRSTGGAGRCPRAGSAWPSCRRSAHRAPCPRGRIAPDRRRLLRRRALGVDRAGRDHAHGSDRGRPGGRRPAHPRRAPSASRVRVAMGGARLGAVAWLSGRVLAVVRGADGNTSRRSALSRRGVLPQAAGARDGRGRRRARDVVPPRRRARRGGTGRVRPS